ncbi:MAG: hypothetical protein IT358_07710 [Gemmatimonadaceae bacterium]|nr:hypothetical protein [Gemmatimonadota bacterium]MCC7323698.1 hypothetical protein [Gemmatimonadaceae bacterium]
MPRIPCSLEFVLTLGRATHFDLRLGRSSFPIVNLQTLEALCDLARSRAWTRETIAPGDVLVTGLARVDGDDFAVPEASVVLGVAECEGNAPRSLQRCTLATARADPAAPQQAMRVVETVQWCDAVREDVSIRWSAMPEEWETAA